MSLLAWLDVLAGATFFVLGVASATTSRRFAVLATLAAVGWFAGDLVPELLLIHRPLLLQVAFSYPEGRIRSRLAAGVLAASWFGTVIQPVGRDASFMIALGALTLFQAGRSQRRPPLRDRAFAATAAQAACALGLSFAVPAAGRLWVTGAFVGDVGLAVYTGLVVVAGLVLLTGVVVRAHGADTDVLIELSEATPDETLAALRAELAGGRDPTARPALRAATELLEANAELQSALLRRVQEVRESRRRIVAATMVERQRLETILSGGAMRYLDELAVTLGGLQGAVDEQTRELIAAAVEQVAHSRDDLEQLAHGLHPRVLAEQGLGPALADLAARSSVPITVRLPEHRYPESVESAVWYACAEAVANVVKHAQAHRATVEVTENTDELIADICDNGVGGAVLTPGGGLAGLSDRLGTVEGTVAVLPATGGGTQVRIRVPVP